jgi:hypothetical protein
MRKRTAIGLEYPTDDSRSTGEIMSETIIYPAPDLNLPMTPETPYERERRAFREMLPELLKAHSGQYVVIHDGKVVASGSDRVAVALEAYSRVGYVPVYLGHVTDEPQRPARIPSPRIWRGRRPSCDEPLQI